MTTITGQVEKQDRSQIVRMMLGGYPYTDVLWNVVEGLKSVDGKPLENPPLIFPRGTLFSCSGCAVCPKREDGTCTSYEILNQQSMVRGYQDRYNLKARASGNLDDAICLRKAQTATITLFDSASDQ